MSIYKEELASAQRQAAKAHQAMEAWLSRAADAPEIPGAILERHAKDLRESRERVRCLLNEHGNRDDIVAALDMSEAYHRSLGLTIRGKPEFEPDADDVQNER